MRQFDSDWQTQPDLSRFDRRILYKVMVARALLYYTIGGCIDEPQRFDLLIIVGGSGLLVIIMTKVVWR